MAIRYYTSAKPYFQSITLGSAPLSLAPGKYLKGEDTGQLGRLATLGLLTDLGASAPAAVTADSTLLIYTEAGDALITGIAVATATPVNAVAALGTITSDATAPSDGDTVTIGSTVYTFKTTLSSGPAVPYEVLIGVSAAVALDNIKSAINATAGAGTTYATGTLIHPSVTATTNTNTTQLVVANIAGTLANAIATTETSTHLAWGAATLAGGVNGTVADDTGTLAKDSTYLYITTAANTIADANWRRVSLGSAY